MLHPFLASHATGSHSVRVRPVSRPTFWFLLGPLFPCCWSTVAVHPSLRGSFVRSFKVSTSIRAPAAVGDSPATPLLSAQHTDGGADGAPISRSARAQHGHSHGHSSQPPPLQLHQQQHDDEEMRGSELWHRCCGTKPRHSAVRRRQSTDRDTQRGRPQRSLVQSRCLTRMLCAVAYLLLARCARCSGRRAWFARTRTLATPPTAPPTLRIASATPSTLFSPSSHSISGSNVRST